MPTRPNQPPSRMLELPFMHPAIPRLLDLQTVDHHIAALRSELDTFPKRIREADLKLNGARAAVAAAKEAHVNGLKERKKFELDVDQWKERARKYRDQSGAVKTNEAYKALQHEIANAEAEMAKAEDRQLEIMMAGEDVERRVKNSEANLRQAEQSVTIERKDIETQQAAKKKELDAALAERERALAPIPEDLRVLYDRIAKRHNGTALALARDGQCRGCGMRVLPHILQLLVQDANDEEVFRCESCGLILYSLEPVVPHNLEAESGNAASASTSS
jgi:predicted  nucleic acid-binding Zn-ribbon protein